MEELDPKTTTVWMIRATAYVAYPFLLASQFILLQGLLLKLFGANPAADYTQSAYRSLDRVMEPFRGIFTGIEIDGAAVLDTSIIFAMVIYAVAIVLLRMFLDWLTYRLEMMHYQRQVELTSLTLTAEVPTTVTVAASESTGPTATSP